ncbi:DUF3991 domain-containing protein [Rhodopirellula baltica]|uniref:Toprim domain-containing protein n=1 Tax=Rhodopirellula baltica SWK14 TaxID=993516 RepID=L7CL35_RHOBT|nr:DUF3991 domain-containing protein [Rhodopirellula baltica]ELP34550.1 hypothetical protein RBSWK_01560 [Rhodopirellula baltica SWK14]
MARFDDELDQMKRFRLTEVAASLGYIEVKKKSTRSTSFMKHEKSGHKIIVSVRAGSGHYTFFTVGGSGAGDAGSCIDLLQMVHGSSFTLGKCRQYMRPFIGGSVPLAKRPDPKHFTPSLLPTSPDVEKARATFQSIAEPIDGGRNRYLNDERKLHPSILAKRHVAAAVFQDRQGRAIFPHRDKHGEVTGFASRGPSWKSFSKGGTKSLWYADPGRDQRTSLCIGEAVISVLSYAALHYDPSCCYLSTEGAMSPLQRQLVSSAIKKLPASGTLTIAADADDAGDAFAAQIITLWNHANRDDTHVKVHQPSGIEASDWNDELVGMLVPTPLESLQP